MEQLIFPPGATEDERRTSWPKIAEIRDSDFGFDTPKEKTDKIRFGVRALLVNDAGEICVIKSEKYGYMQLPGGGIENGESVTEALERETREETGFLVKDIIPMGYTLERREDVRNVHDYDWTISFVLKVSPKREIGTEYMEDEINEGFRPIWIKPEDFIAEMESFEGKIDSYSGCFSNRRDLLITKYLAQ